MCRSSEKPKPPCAHHEVLDHAFSAAVGRLRSLGFKVRLVNVAVNDARPEETLKSFGSPVGICLGAREYWTRQRGEVNRKDKPTRYVSNETQTKISGQRRRIQLVERPASPVLAVHAVSQDLKICC